MTTLKEFGFCELCEDMSIQRANRRDMQRRENEFKKSEKLQQNFLFGEKEA